MKRANSSTSDLDFLRTLMRYAWRWLIFLWERFNPPSHLAMIILFTMGTATLASVSTPSKIIICSLLSTLFFLRLRLFDEIKDYETDIALNPTRPLPRGLLGIFDLKIGLLLLLIWEFCLVSFFLPGAMFYWSVAAAWSLLMYKEFFIADLIRPHLTTYATSHTLVTLPLTLALITGMSGDSQVQTKDLWAALGAWLVFNIFELGRKTFQPSEERQGVESYSQVWGRYGAIILVILHALAASYAFSRAALEIETLPVTMGACVAFLSVSALLYLFVVKKWTGSLWRAASSVYILLVYGALAVIPYLR